MCRLYDPDSPAEADRLAAIFTQRLDHLPGILPENPPSSITCKLI